jgi:hypothetical protein
MGGDDHVEPPSHGGMAPTDASGDDGARVAFPGEGVHSCRCPPASPFVRASSATTPPIGEAPATTERTGDRIEALELERAIQFPLPPAARASMHARPEGEDVRAFRPAPATPTFARASSATTPSPTGEALATTQRIAAAVPGGKCAQVTQLLEGAENALRNTANPEDARALRVEVAKWQGELAALRLADGQGEGARAFRRRCTHGLRGNAAQVLCRRRFAAGRSSASAPFDWLCRTSTWRGRSGCSGCIPSGRHPRRHHGRRRHSPVSRHSPARSRVS